ncbi:MAG TPA: PEGA domain-containing protein, partial [Kofleriaceae bacterium]|nr:PEGA domain-containing protein [Kofleriaceae bacterium]
STAADVAADESIGIKVVSDPDGADVLLSGKSIGTTPLETKIKKGTGQAYLTVHRAGYHDVTTLIDLTGDFSKEVVLKKVGDKDDEKKKPEDDRKKPDKLLEAKRAEELRRAEELKRQRAEELRRAEELKKQQEAKKPKCQPPGQINPFDTSCLGMPGASPSGACPPCKDFK